MSADLDSAPNVGTGGRVDGYRASVGALYPSTPVVTCRGGQKHRGDPDQKAEDEEWRDRQASARSC